MIRLILYKTTGDPLLSSERSRYERMKEVYEDELVNLSRREFKKFKRYWKIADKYDSV